jgi:hypothetical protein
MIDIFRGSFSEAMNVRNLLEQMNMEVFTANEYMSNIEPWVITSGGLNPVTLKVAVEDLEKAKKIVDDYLNGNLEI